MHAYFHPSIHPSIHPYIHISIDRVAVPPESSALYVEAMLALPPSFLPNSHSSNYPLNRYVYMGGWYVGVG